MGLETLAIFASAALSQAGAATFVANAAFFAISNVGTVAITLGSAAFQIQQQQAMQRALAANNQDAGFQQAIKQAIPRQRLLIGETTTAGATFFAKSDPPYTWYGYAFAGHKVDGLQSLIINNNLVFLDEDGFATSTPFRDGSNWYIKASFRNGDIDQAIDPIIAADFPDMPSTFRQRGHATLVIKRYHGYGADINAKNEDHTRVFGDGGQFNPLARIRGALCYDPRQTGHVLSDSSTHEFSRNAFITMARAMTHKWPDMQYFDQDRLDWDKIAEGADICDKWEFDRNGIPFRRYTADGVIQSGDDPAAFLEEFRKCFDGNYNLERGKIYATAGDARLPQATFHINMMTGGFEYQPERSSATLVNTVKPQFISLDRNYQTVKGPVLKRTDLITLDNQPLEQTINLAFVEGDPRAQRHAHYTLARGRAGRSLSVGATMEARDWKVGLPYRVDLPEPFNRVNGIYELKGKTWNANMRGYQLVFIQDTSERFADAPNYEQEFELDDDTLSAEAA